MTNSTHKVEVVMVALEPHLNADSLSIVHVFGGYPCCVRTEDWKDGDLGAYIPPDSVVDTTRPEFAFLGKHSRIRAKRLRGQASMGLLIKAPPGSKEGDDVADYFGVTHYEPPVQGGGSGEDKDKILSLDYRHPVWRLIPRRLRTITNRIYHRILVLLRADGCDTAEPPAPAPVYDLDSMRRHAKAFVLGEPVFITEKIHGENARFCFVNGRMYAGSKNVWRMKTCKNKWWGALKGSPEIRDFCKKNPGVTVYGEIYGQVQDLTYGKKGIEVLVFDLLRKGQWVNPLEARAIAPELPWVPTISEGYQFNLTEILDLAEGNSLVPSASHIREGIVVKPLEERNDPRCGRVCLKVVSVGYLERD